MSSRRAGIISAAFGLDLYDPRLAFLVHFIGGFVIANQARVTLADEIGAELGARLSLIPIGERPRLSAANSMGIYLTYAPVLADPTPSATVSETSVPAPPSTRTPTN